jgi:1-acyl-sn-glycerol-3-phosphate acyltransferase
MVAAHRALRLGYGLPVHEALFKRISKKNPELKGKDIESARKSCEKFKHKPVSIFNFVEGTRFTEQKRRHQNSPYKRLLKPKGGGAALVLYALGNYLNRIINVTIVYPDGIPGLWDYFCGRVHRIIVEITTRPVSQDMVGSYYTDDAFKQRFQDWLNRLWEEKDAAIETILAKQSTQLRT